RVRGGTPDQQRLRDVQAGVGAEVGNRATGVDQHGRIVELHCGAALWRQLPGAEQARRAPPLEPQQLEVVDLLLVDGSLEAIDLGFAERGALVQDDSRGLVTV